MPQLLVTDILVGPVRIYTAPVGTTLPVDTLAEDAAWPAGWVEVAYTKEPLKLAYEFDTQDIEVEQLLAPAAVRKTSENVKVETVMAEVKLQQVAYAFGNGTYSLTTAPGVSTEGLETYTVGGELFLAERMWGFEGKQYNGPGSQAYPLRAFVYRAIADGGGELEFSKKDSVGVPLKLRALPDTSNAVGAQLIKFARVIAPTG